MEKRCGEVEGKRNSKAHGFKWLDSITDAWTRIGAKYHETVEHRDPGVLQSPGPRRGHNLETEQQRKLSLSAAGCVRGAAQDQGILLMPERLHERCAQRRQEGASLESGRGLQPASST